MSGSEGSPGPGGQGHGLLEGGYLSTWTLHGLRKKPLWLQPAEAWAYTNAQVSLLLQAVCYSHSEKPIQFLARSNSTRVNPESFEVLSISKRKPAL